MSQHSPQPLPSRRGTVRLAVGFAALVAALFALLAVAYAHFTRLAEANRWSVHTYRVMDQVAGVREGLVDMETGFRGFALTGDEPMRAQWRQGRDDFEEHLEGALRNTADNPGQQARLRAIGQEGARWMALQLATGFLEAGTPAEQAEAREAASAAAEVRERAARMARLRERLRRVDEAEAALLRDRLERAGRLERLTELLLLGGGGFSLVLAVLLAGTVVRRTGLLTAANRALSAEVAERRDAQAAVERLSRENELLLRAVEDGICGVDVDGMATFVNPAAERVLGRPAADVVGRPIATVLQLDGGGEAVQAALRDGEVRREGDAVLRRLDGRRVPVELTTSPLREGGAIVGAVVVFRDVTAAREVERMKDEFVSVVSHELRTPLTSVRGSLGLLAGGRLGPLPDRAQRLLEIAVENTDRLVRLINDILDIERMESGRAALEMAPADAAALARSAAETMESMAERAGVRLQVEAEPAPVYADPDRILQVLTNLVSNAVKFSPEGSAVELRVRRAGAEVRVEVADRGRGIPPDRLESIFGRFQQVDSSDSRQKGGTGLGLAISRSIVSQHGGWIRAENRPGGGSVFRFALPAMEGAAVAAAPAREEGPRVLVCDADAAEGGSIAGMLERWGYSVVTVSDVREARTELNAHPPDVVLLDLCLPGDDGRDPFSVIREHPAARDVPVIVLGALGAPPLVPAAEPEGVGRPVEESGLITALESVVNRRWKPRRILLVEDDPGLAGVLSEIFGRHGIEVSLAGTGREAVERGIRDEPDMIVLDLGLPDGDGFWVVGSLRRHARLRRAPLVVYSAREVGGEERERLRLGRTEFFTKARVTPEEFETRVIALLNRLVPGREREE